MKPPQTSFTFTPPPVTKPDKAVTDGKVLLGGFTFTSTPTIVQKPAPEVEVAKPQEEPPKAGPFANFTFGSPAVSTPPAFGKSTSVFGAATNGGLYLK